MAPDQRYLAYELRDGILQDLVAIGLLVEAARQVLREDADGRADGQEEREDRADALLARAAATIEGDLQMLRSVIDRLRPAA